MKKLFAVLLALLLALSMVSALADGETEEPQQPQAGYTIKKVYELTNPKATQDDVPDEVLALTVTPIAGAPAVTASYDLESKTFTFNLPEYERVGEYTYTVEEDRVGSAGVEYDSTRYTLTVTVTNNAAFDGFEYTLALLNGEEKTKQITNTYSSGDLTITKEVTGNMGDRTMDFTFKVLLTGATGVSSPAKLEVSGNADIKEITVGQETEIEISHGEYFTIENLPAGMTYEVTEVSVAGYTTTVDGVEEPTNVIEGTMGSADVSRMFTNNNHNDSIDTGITTDSMPYIVLMGIVVLAGVAMIAKRRAANND